MTFTTMPHVSDAQISEAREVFQTLLEMSSLLCTGLDPETLTICVRLCEAGVNPEALATVVRELRKEVSNIESGTDDANQNC
ncbi:hypothetical protein ILUMI_02317 [Ignelater luminosus]|uniref:Mitotic-spindle organizing protein 1 n=1 Tax=Ignelater luminosus TaxID=2038154 RepID=A0A8K0DII3_IGNLU|nr:hypothetical protein ILUMI_02317 [Ignelater luminosus]